MSNETILPGASDDETAVPRDASLFERIANNPRPAAIWAGVLAVLLLLEGGAVLSMLAVILRGLVQAIPGVGAGAYGLNEMVQSAKDVPTLLSREFIPNQGYDVNGGNDGPWAGTFLGLPPAFAWFIRFALVYLYAGALVAWFINGYRVFRRHYRYADWTPRDDVVDRFSGHTWGQFGAIVVLIFIVMALFSPALSPTTVERNIEQPYSYTIEHFDEESGQVEEVFVGEANTNSRSQGGGDSNYGLLSYDDYGRFHPFGTLDSGKDLFTFMMYGARVSLFVGLMAIGLSGFVATVAAMLTAYYKGLVDLATVVVGDSIISIPQLLLLLMAVAVFRGHWIAAIYNRGFLIALIFAFTGWPLLWRAIRGPALQVSSEEWIDAARSYGQRASVTMRKHMLPYVVGYLLVYASMTLGGIIISTAALSFLGLGITSPTPEWGRAVAIGEPYIATQSWHIGTIPGVLIVLVVTAFNALGDGIRDAIDPQSEGGESTEGAMTGGGA
ncbi:ABC transporter permease [Halobacteriales archaeon QS_4_70_19]|nr:MAG: ABC transporter permease [Halobacteriales archaeon QS_4_70_19]